MAQQAGLDEAFSTLGKGYFALGKDNVKELKVERAPATPEGIFPSYRTSEELVYYPRHQTDGDYSENTISAGNLMYTNLRSLLARFFITCHTNFGRIPNWREFCIGMISYDRDSRGDERHMPIFDYDGKNIKTHVRKHVKILQEKYDLGDAWVYKTKRGMHVYFFTDLVSRDDYFDMLRDSECCRGFLRATENHGYGTLRVSAKFTKFDIELEYVLRSKKRHPRRMTRKAFLVQELIRMGQECGTHFASLFPQWAYFEEDYAEWKPGAKNKKQARTKDRPSDYEGKYYGGKKAYGKKIRKVKKTVEYVPQPGFVGFDENVKTNTNVGTYTFAGTTSGGGGTVI